jgi:hypothetical protein
MTRFTAMHAGAGDSSHFAWAGPPWFSESRLNILLPRDLAPRGRGDGLRRPVAHASVRNAAGGFPI